MDNDGIIKGTLLVKEANDRAGSSAEDRQTYASSLIDYLRRNGHTITAGRLTISCAEKFGFCWGVDKAVEIVQQVIDSYPGKQIWILNQIIHNPAVNRDFVSRGAKFIKGSYAEPGGFEKVTSDDVAIIPAFSAEVEDIDRLKQIGCVIIDTTCPWVLKPHLRTKRNIEDGYTTIIHATLGHDETSATCSLIRSAGGKYVVLRDTDEAEVLCDYLRGDLSAAEFLKTLGKGMSSGFDPERDLERVALINQTTMLASESREIGVRIEKAMTESSRVGSAEEVFRDFDTICNATQENQDAILGMVETAPPDLMIVVGGYNSSNTKNLARISHVRGVPTFHIEDASSLETGVIHFQPIESNQVTKKTGWLPAAGPLRVGFTAGASTPDTKLAAAMERVAELAGVKLHEAVGFEE